jgi:hypothetical protein
MANRGIGAMQQAVKNINTPKGGGGGRRFNYFGLEDGASVIVRFITDEDDILTCDFYEFVEVVMDGKTTKQSFIVAPDYYAEDPEWKGEDWVLKYGGVTENYNTKEKESPKPKERTVAIAVEREAVPVEGTGGGRPKFRYQDKIVDVTIKERDKDGKETGKEITLPGRNFILIRQNAKTFWGNVVGYYGEFGTLVDRDYKITRSGVQLATNYQCIPVGEGEEWEDVEVLRTSIKTRYGYNGLDDQGKEVAKDSEDRFLWCPQTLDAWAEDQASEERAKNLLTGAPKAAAQARHAGPATTNGEAGPPWASGDDEAQAAPAPSQGDVSALRKRLEAHK